MFLSYARGDDDAFVAHLHAHVTALGIDVWWDRACMPNRALTFVEEIRDAIHRADRLVLVVGPKALRSDYVRAEWQAALAEHKPVVPVLRRLPEGIVDPYGCLPAELRVFHAPSLVAVDGVDPPLDELVRILGDPVPPPAPIVGSPPELPPHFRPRPDMFTAVADAVLGETTSTRVYTHENRVTVVTGMGGIGKSVLAASFVEALRSRPTTFLADGVYWLGSHWDRETPLQRLAALCGVPTPDPSDERAITDALARHLDEQRFLLVLDDGQEAAQLTPLVRVLGPGGRLLVTTRNGELATGHQRVAVDRLGETEALQLVADWLGTDVDEVPDDARRVVALCGHHPFAIAVNAAAASQGLAWSTIAEALAEHELDLAEHRFEEYVYATVEASLRVSVEYLEPDDRARYVELAAFFWESGVPAAAVAWFWERRGGLSARRAQRLLVLLRQRSLLALDGDPERYVVRLHELHRAYLLSDAPAATALAADLLESYRPDPPDAWWDAPDDGYLHAHLVRHLVRSRPGEVSPLLSAEDGERRNRWYRARVGGAADGFAGYVADLASARGQVPECLLALMAASLRSIARSVPAALLEAAVRDERWSVARAVAHARLVAEPGERAAAMTALLPRVDDRGAWLEATLDAIGHAEVGERARLVEALVPVLAEAELLPALRCIVGWVRAATTPYEHNRTRPLVHPVLRRMPAPDIPEALRTIAEVGIDVPLYLIATLPEPERSARIQGALDEARSQSGNVRSGVLAVTVAAVAGQLADAGRAPLLAEALAAVRATEPGMVRHHALQALLPQLAPADQVDVLAELIDDARHDPQQYRFEALAAAAPAGLHGPIREALETQDGVWIAGAAPAFHGEHRAALVDRALAWIESHGNAASMLWLDGPGLVLAMTDQQLERARRVIDTQSTGDFRVRGLTTLAGAGSPAVRERTVDDALAAIAALTDADDRERAYRDIAPHLTTRQLTAALGAAELIGEPSGIAHLPAMLPHLSAAARERLLALVIARVRVLPLPVWSGLLDELSRGLQGPVLDGLLDRADGLAADEVAYLLTRLAGRVSEHERARTTERARLAIDRIDSPRRRFALLLQLGDVAGAERELGDLAVTLPADDLATCVATLAPHLAPSCRDDWVRRALERGANGRHVVERLAPFLELDQARACLALLIVPRDPGRSWPLITAHRPDVLVPFMEDKTTTAAALARRMGRLGAADAAFALLDLGRDDDRTLCGLVETAPYLGREQVLHIERRLLSSTVRYVAVADHGRRIGNVGLDLLYARLAPSLARVGELDRALRHAEAVGGQRWRVDAHLGIARWAPEDVRREVVATALAEAKDLGRWERARPLDEAAHAVAADPPLARSTWPHVLEWARSSPRPEAIELLSRLAPVAAAAGGTALVDQTFDAVDRVLHWWP